MNEEVTSGIFYHQALNQEFSDIVKQIEQEGSSALENVYVRYRVTFLQWLQSRLGCEADLAKDIYQQSVITFYENVQQGKLTTLTSSVKTYLFSIGRNKFYEAMREQQKQNSLKEGWEPEESSQQEHLLKKVEECLSRLGEPCKSLLIQYYYHKRSIDQLATLFNYKNSDTTKNQKYKCLERLRKMMKEEIHLSIDAER